MFFLYLPAMQSFTPQKIHSFISGQSNSDISPLIMVSQSRYKTCSKLFGNNCPAYSLVNALIGQRADIKVSGISK